MSEHEAGGGGERAIEDLAGEICSAAARIAAATGRWLGLIAEFDRREGWSGHGIKSCAHWLAWKCGLSPNASREHVRVARALTGLPSITAALLAGRLSYSAVRALTRVADGDNEADLLAIGLAGTVAHVEKIVRGWRRADRLSDPEPDADRFGVQVHWDDDGSFRISGRLNAEDGALLLIALTAATERLEAERAPLSPLEQKAARAWQDGGGGPFSPPSGVGQGAALVEISRDFLDPDRERQSVAARHQVVVHVDADVLASDTAAGEAHLDGGPALSAEQVSRIACDAALVVLLRRGREVLDVGRATRSIPAAINRALWARDGGCRFPGCDERRRSRVEGHHIRHWSRGGRTALVNLVLLCGYHHRATHQGAFAVTIDGCSVPVFRDPRGTLLDEQGLSVVPSARATADLPAATEDLLPLWDGKKLDLTYAVSVLRDLRAYRRRSTKGLPESEVA